MTRTVSILALVAALSGCAAKLGVTRLPASGDPQGVVYRAPVSTVVIMQKDSYTGAPPVGQLCLQETTHEIMTLPLGDAYTVNIDNHFSWFAANEFSMSFSDQGVLKEVTLNSDPQVDETLTAAATLLKEVAAVTAAAPAAAMARAEGEEAPGKCGSFVTSRVLCVKTFESWTTDPGCPRAPEGH
jgi:hypothetical protein